MSGYLRFNACRLCGESSLDRELFKYGVRHYACAPCGFRRFGAAFVDRLPLYQVERLPYRAVRDDAGLTSSILERYCDRRRLAERLGRRYTIAQELDGLGAEIVARVRRGAR